MDTTSWWSRINKFLLGESGDELYVSESWISSELGVACLEVQSDLGRTVSQPLLDPAPQRDFPPGCGPSSSSLTPLVPPSAPSGTSSPIPYHVHRVVNMSFIREQSPELVAYLDQIPVGPFQGIPAASYDIPVQVRSLTQIDVERARSIDPFISSKFRAIQYQDLVNRIWLKEIEKDFALTKVSEDLKTDYTSYFLKKDSKYWWESTRVLEGEESDENGVFKIEARRQKYYRVRIQVHGVGLYSPRAALVIESDQRLAAKEKGEKKRKFEGGPTRSEQEGKGHYSTECKYENQGVICFSCDKVGNIARNCRSVTQRSVGRSVSQGPTTSTARARTFKMIKKSPGQDSDVVAGTLSLNSVPVNVLFDSGASKSFISMNCVNKIQLMLEELDEPLTIEVANKDKVPVNIDSKKKRVVMYTTDIVRISYQGQKQDKKFHSVLQAKKLSQKGCEAYLAHVVDTKKETPTLDEIPIVREYPDVFPEELPGLPPD
ncbi:hypothetical protein AgCh_018144 [Apium graveolens]